MRDDEKMFNLGLWMFFGVVCLIVFLQVCYRVQNSNLEYVLNALDNTKYETALTETKYSHLSSGDSLRSSVILIYPNAKTVSYSRIVHINDIPMVSE